jgi:hypothetical protein
MAIEVASTPTPDELAPRRSRRATDAATALEQLVFRLEESLRDLYRGSSALPGLADKVEDLFRDGNDGFVEEDGELLRAALAKSTHRLADFELYLSELEDATQRATQAWFAVVKVMPGLMDEISPLSNGDRWDSLPDFA